MFRNVEYFFTQSFIYIFVILNIYNCFHQYGHVTMVDDNGTERDIAILVACCKKDLDVADCNTECKSQVHTCTYI